MDLPPEREFGEIRHVVLADVERLLQKRRHDVRLFHVQHPDDDKELKPRTNILRQNGSGGPKLSKGFFSFRLNFYHPFWSCFVAKKELINS